MPMKLVLRLHSQLQGSRAQVGKFSVKPETWKTIFFKKTCNFQLKWTVLILPLKCQKYYCPRKVVVSNTVFTPPPSPKKGKVGAGLRTQISNPFSFWSHEVPPASMHLQVQEVSSQSRYGEGGTAGAGHGLVCCPCSRPGYESFRPNLQNNFPARSRQTTQKKQSLKKCDQGNNEMEMP